MVFQMPYLSEDMQRTRCSTEPDEHVGKVRSHNLVLKAHTHPGERQCHRGQLGGLEQRPEEALVVCGSGYRY